MSPQPDAVENTGWAVRAVFTSRPHADPYPAFWFARLAQALRYDDPAAASVALYFAREHHHASA